MARERKPLTPLGLQIILDHNDNLISAANRSIAKFSDVLRRGENEAARDMLNYWKNVRSALKWSSGIARQRESQMTWIDKNGIQHFRTDS